MPKPKFEDWLAFVDPNNITDVAKAFNMLKTKEIDEEEKTPDLADKMLEGGESEMRQVKENWKGQRQMTIQLFEKYLQCYGD